MSDATKKSVPPPDPAVVPPPESGKPVLRGVAVGCGILLVLVTVLGLVIVFKWQNFVRYGLVIRTRMLVNQLEQDDALGRSAYFELRRYLISLESFVKISPLNRNDLLRYRLVSGAFEQALRDGAVQRGEIVVIRGAVERAKIPIRPASPASQ